MQGIDDSGRTFFDFGKIRAVFFRPQAVQGGHVTVGQPQKVQDLADQYVPLRGLAQHMEANMDLAVLQVFHVCVEIRQILAEGFGSIPGDGLVNFCAVGQLQNFFFQGGGLFGIFFLEMAVFVCHFFQFRQFVKSAGFFHGGRQVADKAGAASAFGDDPFSGNGHKVRINVGQGTQGNVRVAGFV